VESSSPCPRLPTLWSRPLLPKTTCHAWTGGSFRKTAGYGWCISYDEKGRGPVIDSGSKSLGNRQTVYDAKVSAIEAAVEWHQCNEFEHMVIHSDSTSAIARVQHPGAGPARRRHSRSTKQSAPCSHIAKKPSRSSGPKATQASPVTRRQTSSQAPPRRKPAGPQSPPSRSSSSGPLRGSGQQKRPGTRAQTSRDRGNPTTATQEIVHGPSQELHREDSGTDQNRPLALRGLPEEDLQTRRQ